ncbi:MAG: Flp family type IVb pilin [Roseobacter sp.]
MMKFIKNFRNDEDGAVTVDWVVLTAAVVGLAVAAYSSISTGANDLTNDTASYLQRQDPTQFQDISSTAATPTPAPAPAPAP